MRRRDSAFAAAGTVAAVLLSACSAVSDVEPVTVNVVSYGGAADALASLDPSVAREQVRDWARLGVASALHLTPEQISDALYDTVPLRDTASAGLAEQPIGTGRSLFDGEVLHLLVDAADPHRPRTLAMLLDQHRADAGADAPRTQLHTYQVDPQAHSIRIEDGPPAATADVRAAHGWVERRVDDPAGLADFLDAADRLSGLEVRGAELWATGWDLPDVRGTVTVDDVATLDAAYRDPNGVAPGFSLDPAPVTTVDDVRALLPGLSPELAGAAFSGSWPAGGFGSAAELTGLLESVLFRNDPPIESLAARGLPTDRTRLWALLSLLSGQPAYSQARYDGDLAGTEVGMTLFYVDLVAKDWVSGVGTGVPTDAVPGFVPDPLTRTPPSLCPPDTAARHQAGRLWFGQSDAAFGYAQDGVTIGARATRLFFRSSGPGLAEAEPDYSFGRGLRWWDAHFQDVADYEPQYTRLDDLMRWSGALEWLSATGNRRLPAVARPAAGRSFADWYQGGDDLRERGPIAFVGPPSASHEAVLPVPSAVSEDCGLLHLSGGVSLADGLARRGGLPSPPAVPQALSRAWPADEARTRVDPGTGGRLERVAPGDEGRRTSYEIVRGPGGSAVRTQGPPSVAVRTGDDRLVVDSTPRRIEVWTRSDGSAYLFDQFEQGEYVGGVAVRSAGAGEATTTEITLHRGIRDTLRAVRDWLRGGAPLPNAPGVRYRQPLQGGALAYRVAGDGAAPAGTWLVEGPTPPASFAGAAGTFVRRPDGTGTTVWTGEPRTIDASSFPVVQGPTTATFGALSGMLPDSVPMYVRDRASAVAAERPTDLPAAAPAPDARVSFTTVRVPAQAGPPEASAPVGGTGWTLVPAEARGGPARGGGGAAGGPGGPGGPPPIWDAGVIVLVTACDDREPAPEGCE